PDDRRQSGIARQSDAPSQRLPGATIGFRAGFGHQSGRGKIPADKRSVGYRFDRFAEHEFADRFGQRKRCVAGNLFRSERKFGNWLAGRARTFVIHSRVAGSRSGGRRWATISDSLTSAVQRNPGGALGDRPPALICPKIGYTGDSSLIASGTGM